MVALVKLSYIFPSLIHKAALESNTRSLLTLVLATSSSKVTYTGIRLNIMGLLGMEDDMASLGLDCIVLYCIGPFIKRTNKTAFKALNKVQSLEEVGF